eukprot:Sdes_comp19214_c0_seq2m10104
MSLLLQFSSVFRKTLSGSPSFSTFAKTCQKYPEYAVSPDGLIPPNYPIMPDVSPQRRDPYKKYDDQQERRNKDEPIHEHDEVLGVFAFDQTQDISLSHAFKCLAAVFTVLGGVLALASVVPYESKAVPREYPYENQPISEN